jgi:hypothetical protein
MATLFHNTALIQHQYFVSIDNSRQAMGDDQAAMPL